MCSGYCSSLGCSRHQRRWAHRSVHHGAVSQVPASRVARQRTPALIAESGRMELAGHTAGAGGRARVPGVLRAYTLHVTPGGHGPRGPDRSSVGAADAESAWRAPGPGALAHPLRSVRAQGWHCKPSSVAAPPHGFCPSTVADLSGDPHGYSRPDGIVLPRSPQLAWAPRAVSLREAHSGGFTPSGARVSAPLQ